jgi:uncharacterized protein
MACEHLASLEGRVKAGELERRPLTPDEQLVVRKGQDHERAYLAKLRAERKDVVSVRGRPDAEGRRQAAAETIALLERGVEIVHNAHFVDLDEGWSGVADFLLRVPGPSRLGDWHYEVADTKLARSAKVSTIVQLCVYGELLERIQGVAPQRMYAILGDGSTHLFVCADYTAYYRRVKHRFLARDTAASTYPEPVEHCARCHWNEACLERRRADDHLSVVANVRRSQIAKLAEASITTAAALAAAPDAQRPRRLQRSTFEAIRAQAALQVAARNEGRPRYEFLPFAAERGFGALPEPDPGDVYFDMEGDPFFDDDGLEYLFGVSYRDERCEPAFRAFWGHDRAAERAAFEAFVDFVAERRARFPNMHVYHFAPYETTALKKLASRHATCEDDVDVLLRERVMVDLYGVVRQALRASFESYSLKSIERFYSPPRGEEVKDALGSVVAYELYRDTRDATTLAEIEAYNRADCDSTLRLHDWLRERKDEAVAHFAAGELPWRERGEITKPPESDEVRDGLIEELLAPIGDRDAATGEERARTLVAHLVPYHKREAKPEWWAYFARVEAPLEELVDESNAIGELTATASPPRVEKKSLLHEFTFPAQEHKLHAGTDVHDPSTKAKAGSIESLDDDAGVLWLKRGPSLKDVSLPPAIVLGGPIPDKAQRSALVRFGRAYATDGATTEYRALGALVRCEPPRVRGRVAGGPLDDGRTDAASLTKLVLALDDSYVFVQGPPGSGKTWLGAQTIVALLAAGKRVGVTAKSHKAIHNLLAWVERFAIVFGQPFRGIKRRSGGDETVFDSPHGLIESSDDFARCTDGGIQLVAGTAWLFSDARLDAAFDVLVIDEAGQVSLADAIACGTAARNVILLGDPMQLPHVSAAIHPPGADASVLTHLLGERDTVSPEMGLFLGTSFRMHASVCAFVSALAYEGRLKPAEACDRQRVDLSAGGGFAGLSGAGLRYLPIAHTGNVQQSPEEADAIVDAVAALLGGTVTDCDGITRPLEQRDILIVTPYNAQVRRLRTTLRTRSFGDVRAGTVDKFQGQEAQVVFFSMASSRGDELPRGREFLFDRNRLNVAVSRARSLAILVCSPALLDTACKNPEQLAMVNALCRFVETAAPLAGI